jgi:hypothetical protein
MLNKFDEKCTREGWCRFRTPLPLGLIYFQYLGGRGKNGRDPVFQVPCIPPQRVSTQGDKTKDKSFQNECKLQRGVGGTACVVYMYEKRGGWGSYRVEVGGYLVATTSRLTKTVIPALSTEIDMRMIKKCGTFPTHKNTGFLLTM